MFMQEMPSSFHLDLVAALHRDLGDLLHGLGVPLAWLLLDWNIFARLLHGGRGKMRRG